MAALSIGARGPEVEMLQQRLRGLGYERVVPDGAFGPATQSAVADLQYRHGLEINGKVNSRLAALIASPDVLPAPKQRPEDIDVDEIKSQMGLVFGALEAPDTGARRVAVANGFISFGPRYLFLLDRAIDYARNARVDAMTSADIADGIAKSEAALSELEDAEQWFADWLGGERFTERVDEAECRARVASMVLDEMAIAGYARIAAGALLALSAGHPLRDVARARSALLSHLSRCHILRNYAGAIKTISDLLTHKLLPDAALLNLIKEGEKLLARIDELSTRRNFWVSVFGFHLIQAFGERERLDARNRTFAIEGKDEPPPSRRRFRQFRARAERALAEIDALEKDLPDADRARVGAKNRFALAALYGLDKPAQSADMLSIVLRSHALDEEAMHDAARLEAKQRLLLGEWERACELLEPRVGEFERRYLAAVDAADIDATGDAYFEVLQTLAWASAAGDRWDRVVHALRADQGRDSIAARAAIRLSFPSALPARDAALRVRGARAARDRAGPPVGLPSERRLTR